MIDNEIILRLERQAALHLSDSDRTELVAQINAVLSCLDVLRTCPDSTAQADLSPCPLRPDTVLPSTDRTALLANAPETDGEFFLVPRTVE